MISRILLTIPMIFILLTTVFVVMRVLPGDPVMLHFEKMENPAAMETMRIRLGLDKPLWAQYLDYVAGLFRGDLGLSMHDYSSVAQQIFSAFPATLELAIYSMIIAVLIGIFLGVESSKAYNKPKDQVIRIFGIVTYAIPVFFLGMIFQMIFGVGLHWLPVGGRTYPGMEPTGLTIPVPSLPSGFLNHFLLSAVIGLVLLGAYIVVAKTRHKKLDRKDYLIALVLFITGWLLWAVLNIPVSSPADGFITHFLLSSVAGLALLGVFFFVTKIRHKKLNRKYLIIALALFVTSWLLWAGLGWYYKTSGQIHVATGLFTIDSLLEGNLYKFGLSVKYLFLPSLTLGLVLCGIFIRLTRSNMLETLRLDFVTAAKARGLKDSTVTYSYALRNAFLPVLTMMGLQFAMLLAGAVLTETTFSWPGLGRYLVDRINFRDYTAIQGTVVVFGILVSLVSLAVDLLYAYLDPRIRL
jgi:ABC-type dipeptide/oligopeptide/nickel transport system permease component